MFSVSFSVRNIKSQPFETNAGACKYTVTCFKFMTVTGFQQG